MGLNAQYPPAFHRCRPASALWLQAAAPRVVTQPVPWPDANATEPSLGGAHQPVGETASREPYAWDGAA